MRLFGKLLAFTIVAQLTTVAIVGMIMHSSWVNFRPPPPAFTEQEPLDKTSPNPPHRHLYPLQKISFVDWLSGPAKIPTIVAIIVGLLSAWLLTLWLTHPILRLHQSMNAIAQGDLNKRLTDCFANRHDELSDLAHSYDMMADKIQSTLTNQQQLLYEVSHELRSPIARAFLHLAQINQLSQPHQAQDLSAIEQELTRMNRLLEELLLRARLSSDTAIMSTEPVDIDEVLRNVIQDSYIEQQVKDCKIELLGSSQYPITGEPTLLHRLFENIIRNAIKYSPDQGHIQVKITQGDQAICVSVIDEGKGIAEADLAHLFTAFARPHQPTQQGIGLGLFISQKITHLHHGSISAHNHPLKGLEISVYLPIGHVN